MNRNITLTGVIHLSSFTLFPEYFISISALYVLIVSVLITYNVYGLMIQKAISECLALVLLMSCYLLINDDLLGLGLHYLTFHNSIVNDYLAFLGKIIVCFSAFLYFLIISNYLKEQKLVSPEYLIVALFAVLGLVLLCGSNDFLTAYLAIELSSLSFYILASFRKTSTYSVESGLKYFIIGSIASAFFLLGCSFLYFTTGSINITEFSQLYFSDELFRVRGYESFNFRLRYYLGFNPVFGGTDYVRMLITDNLRVLLFLYTKYLSSMKWFSFIFDNINLFDLGYSLILFSLFIKLGLAPFHFWSLDVYEGSPISSTFFFAVISKVSIFVFLIRLFYFNFPFRVDVWEFYVFVVAFLSIVVGSFGGLKTRKLKTLLAYSSINHMGYILLTFSTWNRMLGLQMIFFYLIIYILSGLANWFVLMNLKLVSKNKNKQSLELSSLALLSKSNKALAFSYALTMFSLAGIPPLIGFISKMGLFLTIMEHTHYFSALIAILCSVVSTFYYIRIIKIIYFENSLVGHLYYPINNNKMFILSLLIFLLIYIFINPQFVYLVVLKLSYVMRASDIHVIPERYSPDNL